MNCAVCGAGPALAKLRKGDVEILECPRCGLAFWDPGADFHADRVYDEAYFAEPAAERGYDDYLALGPSLRASFARRIAGIPRPREGARLLDAGAAFGFAVDEARRAGWRATGLEISRAAGRHATRIAPGRVVAADALCMPYAAGTFDAVTMWDVIEHLPDPHASVAEVSRVLRPEGRFVLTTGDVGSLVAKLSGSRWHLYTLPEHLFFHTRRSLRILLEAHGFEVRRVRAESTLYTVGYLVERLRKTLLRRPARRPARWPGAGLRIPINLYDIATVHAVRVDGPDA